MRLVKLYCKSCGEDIDVCLDGGLSEFRPIKTMCYRCNTYTEHTTEKPKDIAEVDIDKLFKGFGAIEVDDDDDM